MNIKQSSPSRKQSVWLLFSLFAIIIIIGQIYVLVAPEVQPETSPLAASGLAYIQNAVQNAADNPAFPFLALLAALLIGGLHTLTPGHNKILTGAFLISSKSPWRHAIFIGVATALSHTIAVTVIGTLALSTRGQALSVLYLRYLGIPTGIAVVGLGIMLVLNHLSGGGHMHIGRGTHSHGAEGEHTHGDDYVMPTRLTLTGLVILALIHGVVPTTDALAILLVALSLKQAFLGISLIIAYSLGIAIVMSTIGILFLTTGEQLTTRFERQTRWLPLIGAILVVFFGLSIIVRAFVAL